VLLGEYPVMSLAEARGKAREALNALMEGHDPATLAVEKRHQREAAERAQRESTFAAVAEEFIRYYERKVDKHRNPLRTAAATAADIRRFLVPAWRERPAADVSYKEINKAIGDILDRRGTNAARHAFAAARLLFGWAFRRGTIPADPCERIDAEELHGPPPVRDRVLSDDELRAVWRTAEATPYPYGPLVRLLMLTGQRLSEIAEASWGEVEGTLLTIPAERMKGKIAHTVPLTPKAVEILAELPRWAAGDFLFSGRTGARPFSGFSKAKERFDSAAGLASNWTLHDIRRTVRTALSSAGVLPVVAELTIGHKQQGIAAVYDLHRYDAEKRAALEAWEKKLLSIVAPEPEPEPAALDNVVAMPAARARA
jgi:integrase